MKILFVNTGKRHVLPHFNLGMNSIMAYLVNNQIKFFTKIMAFNTSKTRKETSYRLIKLEKGINKIIE